MIKKMTMVGKMVMFAESDTSTLARCILKIEGVQQYIYIYIYISVMGKPLDIDYDKIYHP